MVTFLLFVLKKKIEYFHSSKTSSWVCFKSSFLRYYYQRPQRPRWPPLSGPLCPRLPPWWSPRALPRIGPPPPLWLLVCGPDPRPRWGGGSWPDSQSGVGGGTGLGGDAGGCTVAGPFFLTGAAVGTIDSSRVLLVAGSPSSPPLARSRKLAQNTDPDLNPGRYIFAGLNQASTIT
jgi:hypothetical protein